MNPIKGTLLTLATSLLLIIPVFFIDTGGVDTSIGPEEDNTEIIVENTVDEESKAIPTDANVGAPAQQDAVITGFTEVQRINATNNPGPFHYDDFRYEGQQHTRDLYEYQARAYDPYTGTWLQPDPYGGNINDPRSLHPYMFEYNSPINYIDPYGYTPTWLGGYSGEAEAGADTVVGYTGAGFGVIGDLLQPQSSYYQVNLDTHSPGFDIESYLSGNIESDFYKYSTGGYGSGLLDLADLGLAVCFEPYDWATTGGSWTQGDFSYLDLAGFLPLIPTKTDDSIDVYRRLVGNVTGSKVIFSSDDVLKSKYMKHAGDFGLAGEYNKTSADIFKQSIIEHINDPAVKFRKGTYRGNQKVYHYYNPETGLDVMVSADTNEFISGWKLSEEQYNLLWQTGNVQ